MHLISDILSKQYGGPKSLRGINLGFTHEKLEAVETYTVGLETGDTSSPLALALCGRHVVVASEFGYVYVLDANSMRAKKIWHAHRNAIFDLKSRPNHNNHVLTASGDQSLTLWDIECFESNRCLSSGMDVYSIADAHLSSVKSISFQDANIVASGARDGMIKLWDIRCSEKSVNILNIPNAHKSKITPQKRNAKKKKEPQIVRSVASNSVTVVAFQPGTETLFSAGANDGAIKIWDMRKLKAIVDRGDTLTDTTSQPLKILDYKGQSYTSAHGFTSLVFDAKSRLYGSCSDHNVYCYDTSSTEIFATYKGARINNFTKCSILKDHLISGSTTSNACIWPLAETSTNVVYPSYTLPHYDEVSAVVTDPINYSIYTTCDDQRLTKWALYPHCRSNYRAEKYECKYLPTETPKVITPEVTPSRPLVNLENWITTSLVVSDKTESSKGINRGAMTTPRQKRKKENQANPRSKKLFIRSTGKDKKISEYFKK
ncbi:Denticleless -like protein [Halotydeus destructor]|nr:Denticleless -like protein [Halotydeus destructor]